MLKMNKILFSSLLLISTTAISAPWQTDISTYDINGEPYTGKAYVNEPIWAEEDFENGQPVRILTDICMRGICEKKEVIKGTPYIRLQSENGKPFNGMVKKAPKKSEGWIQFGIEGLYINGVPDGLHKEFNESGLNKETMYDKGKTLWEKKYANITTMFGSPYAFLESDMQETFYDGGVITDKYYKDKTKILETKTLFDGRLIEISLYDKNKIIMQQKFNADGTSKAENFIDKTKKDLEKNKIYNLYKRGDTWTEREPYNYEPNHNFFQIIAGKRSVCSGVIGSVDYTKCSKDINTPKTDMDILSPEQKQLLYENPSEFFSKNEPKLNLSDVGNQDLKKLNADLEKQMLEAMEMMKASMQKAMEEATSSQTEGKSEATNAKK